MTAQLELIEAEVFKLPSADRAHLLARLVASLDADPEIEAAWEVEAECREAALATGEAVDVSGPEAVARLRAGLVR